MSSRRWVLGGVEDFEEFLELQEIGLGAGGEGLALVAVVVEDEGLHLGVVHDGDDLLGEAVHVAVGALELEGAARCGTRRTARQERMYSRFTARMTSRTAMSFFSTERISSVSCERIAAFEPGLALAGLGHAEEGADVLRAALLPSGERTAFEVRAFSM